MGVDGNDVASCTAPVTAPYLPLLSCAGKTLDDVISRVEVLKFWEAQGIDPPQKLAERLKIGRGLSCKLWWRYFKDKGAIKGVCRQILKLFSEMFTTRKGIENDVEAFLQVSSDVR